MSGETSLGTTTADTNGDWTFTIPNSASLIEGTHSISYRTITEGEPQLLRTEEYVVATPHPSSPHEYENQQAFAVLKGDGSVVTWGRDSFGGDSSAVSSQLTSGVKQIFSNYVAFAALKDNGSVVTWGLQDSGGDSTSVAAQLTSGVERIYSTSNAFAALKDDGSVVVWGHTDRGSIVPDNLASELISDVVDIYTNAFGFAAVKSDGRIISWGTRLTPVMRRAQNWQVERSRKYSLDMVDS